MDPLRHFRDRGCMGGPTKRGVAQGGDPTGLEVGASGVEVALTKGQAKVTPRAKQIEDPTDQVRAVEGGGRTGGGGWG